MFFLGCLFAGSFAAREKLSDGSRAAAKIVLRQKVSGEPGDHEYLYAIAKDESSEWAEDWKPFPVDEKQFELEYPIDGDEISLTTSDSIKISAHYEKPSGPAAQADVHWQYDYQDETGKVPNAVFKGFRWSDISARRAWNISARRVWSLGSRLGIERSSPSIHKVCKRMIKLHKAGQFIHQFIDETPGHWAASDANDAWGQGDTKIQKPFVYLFDRYKKSLEWKMVTPSKEERTAISSSRSSTPSVEGQLAMAGSLRPEEDTLRAAPVSTVPTSPLETAAAPGTFTVDAVRAPTAATAIQAHQPGSPARGRAKGTFTLPASFHQKFLTNGAVADADAERPISSLLTLLTNFARKNIIQAHHLDELWHENQDNADELLQKLEDIKSQNIKILVYSEENPDAERPLFDAIAEKWINDKVAAKRAAAERAAELAAITAAGINSRIGTTVGSNRSEHESVATPPPSRAESQRSRNSPAELRFEAGEGDVSEDVFAARFREIHAQSHTHNAAHHCSENHDPGASASFGYWRSSAAWQQFSTRYPGLGEVWSRLRQKVPSSPRELVKNFVRTLSAQEMFAFTTFLGEKYGSHKAAILGGTAGFALTAAALAAYCCAPA
jgi:hypothetical protein